VATPDLTPDVVDRIGKALAELAAFFSLLLHTPAVRRRLEGSDRRVAASEVSGLVREVAALKSKAERVGVIEQDLRELREDMREDFRAVNGRLDTILTRL
jgi:hypothetical protein